MILRVLVLVHLGVLYWINVSESSGAGSPGCAILD